MPIRVIKSAANLFSVFSNPTRLQILIQLNGGEKDVKEIHELLDLSHSNASQHLAVLRAHHLVDIRQEGTHVYYRLHNEKVIDIIREAIKYLESEFTEAEEMRKVIDKVGI